MKKTVKIITPCPNCGENSMCIMCFLREVFGVTTQEEMNQFLKPHKKGARKKSERTR